ncbi:MAG: DUF63 family protein [Candidatus Hydrothermarchaeota archaeon]
MFIKKYFIEPIYKHTGYNVVNTIFYGLLLGFGIIASEKLVRRLNVKVDKYLVFSLLPFLVLASCIRSLVDANILKTSFFFVTPGIFFLIFFIVFTVLLISLLLEKRLGIRYYYTASLIGTSLSVYPLFMVLINVIALKPLLYIFLTLILSTSVIFLGINYLNISKFKESWIKGVFFAHMLDFSATFVAVDFYGYFEEHVFENFLIKMSNTALILFPLKIVVISFVILIIQSLIDEKSLNFWYFALFILGFSPGLRDTLTLMLLG